MVVEARLLLAENQTTDALTRAEQAVKIDPRLPQAHLTLGRIYNILRREGDAIRAFNEVLRLDPDSIPAKLELSELHLRRNEVETAIQLAEQAVSATRNNLPARLTLVRALIVREDDRGKAEKEVRTLLAAYPRTAAVHIVMGSLYLARTTRPQRDAPSNWPFRSSRIRSKRPRA